MTDAERLLLYERSKDPPRMRVTERDRAVLHALWQHRYMRVDQISALFFPSDQMAYRRLKLLFHNGYVARLPLRDQGKLVYALDARGAGLVALEEERSPEQVAFFEEDEQDVEYFLAHTLAIADVRVVITRAAREQGGQLVYWWGERELKEQEVSVADPRGGKRLPLNPDALFVYRRSLDEFRQFFLEVDRGTEPVATQFVEKVRAYQSYLAQGPHFTQYAPQIAVKVLTITTTKGRLENLRLATEREGGDGTFLFTLFEQINAGRVLGRVWKLPAAGRLTALLE